MKKKLNETDIIDELTTDQRKQLEESIKQADRGETIPHSVVMKRMKKLFKKLERIKEIK